MPDASTEAPISAEAEKPARELPWGEVTPEQFQMLRLLPLPVDRASGSRPLRFVQFGRAERHSPGLSLLRLEVQLPGQRVRAGQNRLDVWADHQAKRVWAEPAQLSVEPVNRGLGRFLLAQAAAWLQQRRLDYVIDGQAFTGGEATVIEDVRLRRDHMLRMHGFDVEYEDAQHLKGGFKDLAANLLLAQWNPEKVQLVDIVEAANMLQLCEERIQSLDVQVRKRDEQIAKYRREDGSLRFTIACLIAFTVFQAGLLIWIATHR